MTEASFYGDASELGLPSSWVAMAARADAREVAAERREAEARRERAEDRREATLFRAYQQALAEGREGVDFSRPSTYVPSVDEIGRRVFDEEDKAIARAERRQAIADGRLHVIDLRADEMGAPSPSAEREELADGWAERMRQRTEREGVRAKIRRWALNGKGARS